MLEARQVLVQTFELCGQLRLVQFFVFAVLPAVLCSGMGSPQYGMPDVWLVLELFNEFQCEKIVFIKCAHCQVRNATQRIRYCLCLCLRAFVCVG